MLGASCLFLPTAPVSAETLQQALARAYGNNPTLTAARAGLRAVDEDVPLAKADGRPNAGITGSYTEELHRPFPESTPRRNAAGQVSLSVPIYQGGVVRNRIRSAVENVKAGQQDLRATEASVFSAVVAAYMDVISDTSVVSYNRQNVASLEANFQASRDRFEVGDVTRTDVAQSESRLALARASLQAAEAQLINSKENYIALVGAEPDNLEPPPPLPGLPASAESAVTVALRDNPDLLAAQHNRAAAHHNVNAAKGLVSPRLSAVASGSYTDYLGSQDDGGMYAGTQLAPNSSVKAASAGVQLTIPIYQGGQPGAQTRQNIARESQAIEYQVEIERNVIAQTRSAYASWQASMHAIESNRLAVSAGELSLEGVRAENGVGTRTILDILDSQRDLLNAQVQYVTAQRNAYVAGFSLLAAMGHAQAADLNLNTGGPLYDPAAHYDRVKGKLFDFDFGTAAVQQASGTADTAIQSANDETSPPATGQ
ncbi:MAG: TolC family outer membrane protein [Sphingobium sp.]